MRPRTLFLPLCALVTSASCTLDVKLPEGRIRCSADEDCPPRWSCRVPSADEAGLCYRTADDTTSEPRDAGADASTGVGPGDDGATGEADAETGQDGGVDTDARVGSAPVVSVVADGNRVLLPGSSSGVLCMASDADGDPLSYGWSSPSGRFFDLKARATDYTASDIGPVDVTCTVSDGTGNEGTGVATLRVYPPGLLTLLPFSLSSVDASANGRDGSLSNAVYTNDRAGTPSSAIELAGSGSVTLADPQAFSLASWSFVATIAPQKGAGGTILDKSDSTPGLGAYGLLLYRDDDPSLPGRIQYYQRSSGLTPFTATLGTFQAEGGVFFQLAVTRSSSGELHAFVDGSEIATVTNLPSPVASSGPLELGTGILGGFSGILDEVQVYSRVLTADEVSALTRMQ